MASTTALMRSSKGQTGFKGVRPHRGRFQTTCDTGTCRHNNLGTYDSAEVGAQAYLDHWAEAHAADAAAAASAGGEKKKKKAPASTKETSKSPRAAKTASKGVTKVTKTKTGETKAKMVKGKVTKVALTKAADQEKEEEPSNSRQSCVIA